MRKILFVVVFILTASAGIAQKTKDLGKIKTPQIEFVAPDTTLLMEDEADLFSQPEVIKKRSNTEGRPFEEAPPVGPQKELSIVSEDTADYDDFDEDIVEVTEEILIDTFWIKIAEHFAIWDSKKVDPYNFGPEEYKDTIIFTLYDSLLNNWAMPIKPCKINDDFGSRYYRWHYGTDLDLNIGDPVLAAFDGVVRIAKVDPRGYGNYVLIRHVNGLETIYGHLKRIDVNTGETVKAGQQIGLGGNTGRSTGPHLHFETRYYGNAFDSEFIYDYAKDTIRSRVFTLLPSHYSYAKEVRKMYFHKVRSGDTLSKISRKYRVPVARICKLNKISTKTTLKVGRRLRIR